VTATVYAHVLPRVTAEAMARLERVYEQTEAADGAAPARPG
jgi:hypothetical protein